MSLKHIAILITVHNRKEKTLHCLNSVAEGLREMGSSLKATLYLTDDGSTDGTGEEITKTKDENENHNENENFKIQVLQGDGALFWNGGMIHSWQAALEANETYDGYLWLNNDTTVLPKFWKELTAADEYCRKKYDRGGIYVGSVGDEDDNHNENDNHNEKGRNITYGGFNFTNRWTLRDEFVKPNGTFQPCQCAHGNLTYVSQDVVDEMGIFTNEYIHSGGDHDYTYRAYKHGFPLLVLPSFVGVCKNDHPEDGYADFLKMPLKERLRYLKSPLGFNLHNTLVFQRRCFPYRYPFVWTMGYLKALFPQTYWRIYQWLRR